MNHNRSTALERSVKITGGLKPVLRDPNLALSFYKTTNGIKILIKPVSAAEDMLPGPFQSYQLLSETLFVPEQKYTLTQGYAITYETNP